MTKTALEVAAEMVVAGLAASLIVFLAFVIYDWIYTRRRRKWWIDNVEKPLSEGRKPKRWPDRSSKLRK